MEQVTRLWAVTLMLLFWTGSAAAQTPVDTALVLAVDASGSIDEAEFRLQKEGIALAVTDARILGAVRSGPLQRIAIAYVEWGGPGAAQTVVNWMIVESEESAQAFAAAVLAAPRSVQTYNAIGDVIVHAGAMFDKCPCEPSRAIIDISGDNPDNRSIVPAPIARDTAAAAGITINALAILQSDMLGPSGRPLLVENYENEVIGGPGAFVIAAEDRGDFARALLQKMVLEIANLMPTARHLVPAGFGRSLERDTPYPSSHSRKAKASCCEAESAEEKSWNGNPANVVCPVARCFLPESGGPHEFRSDQRKLEAVYGQDQGAVGQADGR